MQVNRSGLKPAETHPPKPMMDFVGGGDFSLVGQTFLGFLKELGGLIPNERILDVGCGCGRIAIPLTRFLTSEGRYEGFDIYREGIEWCTNNLTAYHPNFQFRFVDIHNRRYNPFGTLSARTFQFPYQSETFDLVLLSSVLTHLPRMEMLHYVAETSRVLRKGGRCLATYFLFFEGRPPTEEGDRNRPDFRFESDKYRTVSKDEIEYAIAFEEAYIRSVYKKAGLRIKEPIYYGQQDIVVAVKEGGWVHQTILRASDTLHRIMNSRSTPTRSELPVNIKPGLILPADGIWTDPTGVLHLYIQTYAGPSCVVIATLDAVGFVGFRSENFEDGVYMPMDAGKQGYSLKLELTDPWHGNVKALLPPGEILAEVSCLVPAKK